MFCCLLNILVLDSEVKGVKGYTKKIIKYFKYSNQEEMDEALNYVNAYHPTVMTEIITYQAGDTPFSKYLFEEHIVSNISPLIWWTSLKNI